MTQAPPGWAKTTLEELVTYSVGGVWGKAPDTEASRDDVSAAVMRGADFRDWAQVRAASAALRQIPEKTLASRRLNEGDLVVEVSGGGPTQPVGRVVLVDRAALMSVSLPLVCSNFCRRVVLHPEVRPEFIAYQLLHGYASGDTTRFQTATTNIRNLSFGKYLAGTALAFPPAREQDRIVAAIEEQFSRLDAGVAALESSKESIKHFRSATLQAAVTGRLSGPNPSGVYAADLLACIGTKRQEQLAGHPYAGSKRPPEQPDTSELPRIPVEWAWATLDQLCTRVVDGVHKKPDYVATGVPFVTVRNLTAGNGISLANLNHITREDHAKFIQRAHPRRGDLLISKDGTLGVVRAIREDQEFSIFVSVALLNLVSQELTDYLEIALSSPMIQRKIVSKGSGLQHIHLEDLRRVCVPIPPLAQQRQIVSEVSRQLSLADHAAESISEIRARAEALRASILSAAFSGQLVPQDPTDEPASILLERIAAERTAATPNGRKPARNSRQERLPL